METSLEGAANNSQRANDEQLLVTSIADLNEDLSLELTNRLMGESSGRRLLNLALEGLKIVGHKYEEGEYYVAGLVMAGEIMRQILEMVTANSSTTPLNDEKRGVIVLGTVEGDIHDLGKDMVKEILAVNGFEVHDLGVDVAPEVYLAETIRFQPDLVGLSILISSSYPALTKTVNQLRTMIPAGFKRPGIMVGGGAIDETVFKHIKADLWCRDLTTMGDVCHDWITGHNNRQKVAPKII